MKKDRAGALVNVFLAVAAVLLLVFLEIKNVELKHQLEEYQAAAGKPIPLDILSNGIYKSHDEKECTFLLREDDGVVVGVRFGGRELPNRFFWLNGEIVAEGDDQAPTE